MDTNTHTPSEWMDRRRTLTYVVRPLLASSPMSRRNAVSTEPQSELIELHARLAIGLEQARSGDFAEGDGEQAVRRAFAEARKAQSRTGQQSTPPQ